MNWMSIFLGFLVGASILFAAVTVYEALPCDLRPGNSQFLR